MCIRDRRELENEEHRTKRREEQRTEGGRHTHERSIAVDVAVLLVLEDVLELEGAT